MFDLILIVSFVILATLATLVKVALVRAEARRDEREARRARTHANLAQVRSQVTRQWVETSYARRTR